ncbi:MAG TPA: DUF3576 domain-containing protein [Acetobacteraceae bacterium]|nr:DUF3576 domain-containing protein [Acetobacteraceae bacterium]
MPIRWFGISLLLTASLGLAACSGVQTEAPTLNRCDPGTDCGSLTGSSQRLQSSEMQAAPSQDNRSGFSAIFGFGGQSTQNNGGNSLAVNAFLWRGALDTISFMPLASADPFGGVILTDWYTPPSSPNERFKATIFILGRELRSNNLRISIFRQVLQNGQWVDAQVSPNTVNDIEDKVLARARRLRVEMK